MKKVYNAVTSVQVVYDKAINYDSYIPWKVIFVTSIIVSSRPSKMKEAICPLDLDKMEHILPKRWSCKGWLETEEKKMVTGRVAEIALRALFERGVPGHPDEVR